MIVFGLALLVLSLCLVATATAVMLPRFRTATKQQSLTGETLLVHTCDDQSIRGVLVARHSDRITLADVVVLHASGEQPANGVAHIPWANVAWIQELTVPVSARSADLHAVSDEVAL